MPSAPTRASNTTIPSIPFVFAVGGYTGSANAIRWLALCPCAVNARGSGIRGHRILENDIPLCSMSPEYYRWSVVQSSGCKSGASGLHPAKWFPGALLTGSVRYPFICLQASGLPSEPVGRFLSMYRGHCRDRLSRERTDQSSAVINSMFLVTSLPSIPFTAAHPRGTAR
jgi:hypothetical protein